MRLAISKASEAAANNEIPVGAVLVTNDTLLAAAGNSPISNQDPTAHAEIVVIRQAAKQLQNYRLPATTLYVTLEPCIMCMGAILHARIERLVYGADDPKTGAAGSVYSIGTDGFLNHHLEVQGGILAEQCSGQLKAFFKQRRKQKNRAF